MTAVARHRRRSVLLASLIAAAGLLLVLANLHLVYVAVTSEPPCVPHIKTGDRAADGVQFSAAGSAC